MTYNYISQWSGHKNIFNNPLMYKRSIWSLKLLHGSFRQFKRTSVRGKYYRMLMRKRRYWIANPLTQNTYTSNEIKVWGKFHR